MDHGHPGVPLMSQPSVTVSERGRKRLKGKHPWVFSNEITAKPEVPAGAMVEVRDERGHFLGSGYYNPHTLIAVRILSHHGPFDLSGRIAAAVERRTQHYGAASCRLVYGESDGLPGLIVDRYGDTLVVQILTAGMELMKDDVVRLLSDHAKPSRMLLRNDSTYRKLEGLETTNVWPVGEPAESVVIEVDGLKLSVNLTGGQKTGFFLDQQENRNRVAAYARGARFLDAFSYTGAWALYAARAGMKKITAVDSSKEALAGAIQNAELNGYSITTIADDVFEFLRRKYSTSERYDMIALDPPAFCKSRKQVDEALKGYREINLRAMKLLSHDGVLITCSCSQPVTPDLFLDMLRDAAADSGRAFALREFRLHPPDHPVLLHFPESLYLKCAILELV